MNCKTIFIGGILLVLHEIPLMAQVTASDAARVRLQIRSQWHAFHALQAENQAVYNGAMYMDYPFTPTVNQYAPEESWTTGQVTIAGETFRDLKLKFDASRDQLILHGYRHPFQLVVPPEQLDSFLLGHHDFVHVFQPIGSFYGLYPGYFDKLYGGKTSVFAHYSKRLQTHIQSQIEYTFESKTTYFISTQGRFWEVDRKAALFALFPHSKRDIRHYWHSHRLKFRKNKAEALSDWAFWHDNHQSH